MPKGGLVDVTGQGYLQYNEVCPSSPSHPFDSLTGILVYRLPTFPDQAAVFTHGEDELDVPCKTP